MELHLHQDTHIILFVSKFLLKKNNIIIYNIKSYFSIFVKFLINYLFFSCLATSNGTRNGMSNSQGGFCVTKNMRLKIDYLYNNVVTRMFFFDV